MPGYPIRTPWDPRSVDNSPRPIAASHVLHRLLVPRHPPYALSNLTTNNQSTVGSPQTDTTYLRDHNKLKDARIHCAILKQHATHHPHPPPASRTTTPTGHSHTQHGLAEDGTGQKQQPPPQPGSTQPPPGHPHNRRSPTGGRVVLSGPNRMSLAPHHGQPTDSVPHHHPRSLEDRAVPGTQLLTAGVICQCLRHMSPSVGQSPTDWVLPPAAQATGGRAP